MFADLAVHPGVNATDDPVVCVKPESQTVIVLEILEVEDLAAHRHLGCVVEQDHIKPRLDIKAGTPSARELHAARETGSSRKRTLSRVPAGAASGKKAPGPPGPGSYRQRKKSGDPETDASSRRLTN